MPAKLNLPSSSEVSVRTLRVCSLMSLTLAPGMMAPAGSVTAPEIVPVTVCAKSCPQGAKQKTAIHTDSNGVLIFDMILLLLSRNDVAPSGFFRRGILSRDLIFMTKSGKKHHSSGSFQSAPR